MDLTEISKSTHTILFVLFLVIIVSVWFSRTYQHGEFSKWMTSPANNESKIVEGLTTSGTTKVVMYGPWIGREIDTQLTSIPIDRSRTWNVN